MGQTGLMKLETQAQFLQEQCEAAAELLSGQTISLALGNPLLLAAMTLLPPLRGKVLWSVTTEKEALQEAAINSPDLLVLTDELESGYGPSLIKELKTTAPHTNTLIFLERETAAVVEECLEAGATGICFQSNVSNGKGDFMKALQALANRGVYYPDEVRNKAGYVAADPFALVLPSDITEREKEVLIGLSEGQSNKEISETLFISIDTVKSHLKNITSKLGVKDRTGAAIYAIRAGVSRR